MQTNRFTSLREISKEVNEKIQRLHSGEMSLSEIEQLAESGRELYERLVALKYKAYEDEVKGKQEEVAVTLDAEENTPAIAFRIEEEPKPEFPAQVSLIDAIEEVTRTEVAPSNEIAEEPVQAELPLEEVAENQAEVFTPVASISEESKSEETLLNNQKESLHDKLARTLGNSESLAQKMEHHPISDLKRAITLNQRFQFSKELFKGNNQDYEVAIERLNNTSREDAMKQVEALRNKYQWSSESAVTSDFLDLVERRYL